MMQNDSGEIKVWDLAVRMFHWLLVGGFFAAYLSEDDWMSVHVWAGYLVFGLIAFRLLWGFIGPRPARFSDFVHGPKTVLQYLWAVLQRQAQRHTGHNPAGGAMIVALLIFVVMTTLSGMAYYGADAWLGPLAWLMKDSSQASIHMIKEVHEFSANMTVLLVAVHVSGVLWESLLHRENLVKSMITGRKRVDISKPISE